MIMVSVLLIIKNKIDFYFLLYNLFSMSLTLILGPMFSGKSTKMLEYYRKYSLKYNCLLLNHSLDKRYSKKDKLFTHDMICENCIFINKINDIFNLKEYKDSNVIFIDEGQFFEDILLVNNIINDNKIVFVSGLKGDFKNNIFGNLLKLVPICDDLIMLKSICSECKVYNDGIFSKKIHKNNSITDVGSTDKYIPVCRKHY